MAFFGSELRYYRMRAGWTQEQLGERVHCVAALISSIETGTRKPQPEFARRCDEELGTDGALERLLVTLDGEPFPGWFRPWLEIERGAHTLRSWESLIIPGLLQAEEYARELIRTYPWLDDEQVEERTAARMERQKILRRSDPPPPMLWVVLHENVLHCEVGNPKVMRDQLRAIVEASRRPRTIVQVVPVSVGVHAGHLGAFAIASLNGEQDVVYFESARAGQVTDRHEDVQEMVNIWEAIRMKALPDDASLKLIEKVAGQWT